MNSNLVHNALNLIMFLVGALLTFDWTGLGASPQVVGIIISALTFVKLAINAFRDGIGGMVKPQPPVQK